MSRPVFLVIAGPNGAGKTTAAEPLLEVMGIETYDGLVDEWRFYDNSSDLSLLATGPNIQDDIDRLNAYRKQIHD